MKAAAAAASLMVVVAVTQKGVLETGMGTVVNQYPSQFHHSSGLVLTV